MDDLKDAARLRRFGFAVGSAAAMAALAFAWQELPRAAAALGAAAAFLLLAGAVRPGFLRPIEWAWTGFGRGLGWLNTRILVGAAFFLMVVPMGLLLRLFGRDALAWRRDPARRTYFEPHRTRMFPRESFERTF